MDKKTSQYIYCGLFINIFWCIALLVIMIGPFIIPAMPILTGWWIGVCSFSIISLNIVFFLNLKNKL